jgi:hypothetical protein
MWYLNTIESTCHVDQKFMIAAAAMSMLLDQRHRSPKIPIPPSTASWMSKPPYTWARMYTKIALHVSSRCNFEEISLLG